MEFTAANTTVLVIPDLKYRIKEGEILEERTMFGIIELYDIIRGCFVINTIKNVPLL